MLTGPQPGILRRDPFPEDVRRVLSIFRDGIDVCVDRTTHTLSELINNESDEHGIATGVIAALLRHIAEYGDAISVLIPHGIAEPATSAARSMLEVHLQILYICETDSEDRARQYNFFDKKRRLEDIENALDPNHETHPILFSEDDDGKIRNLMQDEKKRLNEFLAHNEYSSLKTIYPTKKWRNWYEMNGGPGNIRCLAERLGELDLYIKIYKHWSGNQHGGNTLSALQKSQDDSSSLLGIRNPRNCKTVALMSMALIRRSNRVIYEKILTDGLAGYRQWHDEVAVPKSREILSADIVDPSVSFRDTDSQH